MTGTSDSTLPAMTGARAAGATTAATAGTTEAPHDHLAVLTGMYQAEARYLAAGGPGKAHFALLAPYFAPDVVLHQADALPYGGVWRGHQGMERFFLAMSDTWDRFDMLEQRFLAVGDPVVVLTQVRARARATGRELRFPILQTIGFRGGRIAEVRPFYWDTAAIAHACTAADSVTAPGTASVG